MKPLYDRYRLVKQILCRASTIPVIVSVASSFLPFAPAPSFPAARRLAGDLILGLRQLPRLLSEPATVVPQAFIQLSGT